MGKNVRDNLVYILLHVPNDKSLNVFMQEKNEHRQRCSLIMECHRANISHKAVESHQPWILLYKCQIFKLFSNKHNLDSLLTIHGDSNTHAVF